MNYTSEYESSEYIHVNSCDCQHLSGRDIGSVRENGRADYHILYITEGACFIKENNIEHCINAGSVILYFPRERQEYHFKADIPSTSYYVHFSGTGCRDLLERLGFNCRYFYIGESSHAESLFKRMTEEYFAKRKYSNELCSGYLYTILSVLAAKKFSSSEVCNKSVYRIEKACRDMIRNYNEPLDIKKYSSDCNLSPSRFTHLFKECTGKSPQAYIIGIRIKKACELLENTDLSVSKIGELVGISDQNYFSRIFKIYTSKSPTAYRNSFI